MVCPLHLVVQWHEEIEKIAPSLNVVVLTSFRDIKGTTYTDIINAGMQIFSSHLLFSLSPTPYTFNNNLLDVVVMPTPMFKSPQYFHLGDDPGNSTRVPIKHEENDRPEWIDSYLSV